MKTLQKCAAALCLALFFPLAGVAQNYPDHQSLYVNDFGDIIDAQSQDRIESMLRAAKTDRDLEITVVTINQLSDYDSRPPIATFATGLFNHWGVGNPDRNDGILILVSKGDREMRIALGSGYPDRYDNRAKNVIDHYFLPYFRQDRYAIGIEVGVEETLKRLALEFGPNNRPTFTSQIRNERSHISDNARGGGLWAWILGALGLGSGGVGFKLFRRWQRFRPRKCDTCGRKMRRLAETDEDAYLALGQIAEEAYKSKQYDVWYCSFDEHTMIESYPNWFTRLAVCPSCSYHTLHSRRVTVIAATTSSTGSAEITRNCRHCDHHKVETVTVPRISKSSSSGSSSGGFSGGSSSGGGASGSW